jgi:hypothetical protein
MVAHGRNEADLGEFFLSVNGMSVAFAPDRKSANCQSFGQAA